MLASHDQCFNNIWQALGLPARGWLKIFSNHKPCKRQIIVYRNRTNTTFIFLCLFAYLGCEKCWLGPRDWFPSKYEKPEARACADHQRSAHLESDGIALTQSNCVQESACVLPDFRLPSFTCSGNTCSGKCFHGVWSTEPIKYVTNRLQAHDYRLVQSGDILPMIQNQRIQNYIPATDHAFRL